LENRLNRYIQQLQIKPQWTKNIKAVSKYQYAIFMVEETTRKIEAKQAIAARRESAAARLEAAA